MKILLFFLIISLFPIDAAVYRTSSAAEIKEVLKKVNPGDTLIMNSGIWKDQEIVFSANGTKQLPVYLIAEEKGEVILTGSSKLKIYGDYLVVDGLYFKDGSIDKGAVIEFRDGVSKISNYSRLTNTAIVDYNPPDINTDYKWVSLYGRHNRVDHCYFEGKNHSGTTLVVWLDEEPNYHLIDSNYFGHRPDLGFNGGETIRVGTSHWSMYDSYTTVENNYFEKCNGEREIISNKSCKNVYRYNTFYECAGTLTLRHGNDCTVESNFFFGGDEPLSGGVRVIGENHKIINNYFYGLNGEDVWSALPIMNGVPNSPLNRYFRVKNALVAFNTFINCRYNIIIGTGADDELSLVPENSIIANNIFLNSPNPVINRITEPQNFKMEGNIYFNTSPGTDSAGFINKEPQYYKNCFWKLSGADLQSEGKYDFISYDIEGQKRGEIKNPGCDQYSHAVVLNKPLSRKDTGPVWLNKK